MIEHRMMRGTAFAVAIGAAVLASAANRTTVTLVGKDDSVRKLGMPGISLEIVSPDPAGSAVIRDTLSHGFTKLAYTRPLRDGEAGDYALTVRLDPLQAGSESSSLPFHAELSSADGHLLWRIEGRTDLDGDVVDATVLASIGRNVLSALIHDGWVQPRYDVNDPPPPPPSIRQDDSVVKR